MLSESQKKFYKLSSFQILATFRRGLFYSFLSIYLRFYLGLSVTETTFFATFPLLVNILFQNVVWGRISDKYQKRRSMIIWGEILAGIGTALTWFVHSIQPSKHISGYVLIIGLTIIEIFWSMSNLGWTALLSDIFKPEKIASIRGRLTSIGGFGRIIGVMIGGLAYDGLGHHFEGWGFSSGFLFFFASAAMLLSCIPIFFLPEGGVSTSDKDKESYGKLKNESKSALKLFTLFIVSMILINFGRNSIAIIKTQYFSLDEGMALSPTMLSYIVNMRSIAMIGFGILVGVLLKKMREEWILFFSSLLSIIHLLMFTFSNSIIVLFLANFLGGGSEVLIIASSYAVANYMIPPAKRGRRFAIYNATIFLSWGIAGTLIAGPIVDLLMHYGYGALFAYKSSFLVAATITLIGIIVLLIFIKKYHAFYQSESKIDFL